MSVDSFVGFGAAWWWWWCCCWCGSFRTPHSVHNVPYPVSESEEGKVASYSEFGHFHSGGDRGADKI